jgi:pyruvate,orthophosphate dikinase
MSHKYVYLFSEGDATMRNLLGGKGANLAEMTNLGLPVPQGFTVTTEACTKYYEDGRVIAQEIVSQIYDAMSELEKITGKKFGDVDNPFLVSVRSGARASMPGMMDTVLNLGLNDDTVEGLARLTDNERFAYDSYRRFIQMFSDVVMEIDKSNFDEIMDKVKEENGVTEDSQLTAENFKEIVKGFKDLYRSIKGEDFPQDPKAQLLASVEAVFRSWDNPRAIVYRRMNDIPGDWGTAVNVQAMVFGNMGEDCGTGVAFTRNPATGENKLYGEYLINAQGEDVVAGIRTPEPIDKLKEVMPEIYHEFAQIAEKLEKHYKDMQDMEFTIEKGKLYMLQTRSGKRTAAAALKVAVDLVGEGLINKKEALLLVDPRQLDALLHPTFEPVALKAATPIGRGLPASPGAATGHIYFTAEAAAEAAKAGQKVILVRQETSPEDIEGMYAAEGILTSRGGMTSHAAVVARGIGTCCVAGCADALISESAKNMIIGGKTYNEGDFISLDGSTGNIYGGELPTEEPTLTGDFATLMKWADEHRRLAIRTNADTPRDAQQALEFGSNRHR